MNANYQSQKYGTYNFRIHRLNGVSDAYKAVLSILTTTLREFHPNGRFSSDYLRITQAPVNLGAPTEGTSLFPNLEIMLIEYDPRPGNPELVRQQIAEGLLPKPESKRYLGRLLLETKNGGINITLSVYDVWPMILGRRFLVDENDLNERPVLEVDKRPEQALVRNLQARLGWELIPESQTPQ